ncbi:hypothetical protein Ntsu_08610 [Nocardia sp. IFM 10818]
MSGSETPTTLLLLRHGETALTPERRLSGSGGSDPALSETGRRQAEAVADLLASPVRRADHGPVRAVVSSPLRRCRETAAAAARRLGLEVLIDDGLREADFGGWEGLTFAEVREKCPGAFAAWLTSPASIPGGTGESFESVAHRVALSRDKLLARYAGETVLVVSHVTPVRQLIRLALGAPPESLFRLDTAAASLSAVAYDGAGNAAVRFLNDTSHLR